MMLICVSVVPISKIPFLQAFVCYYNGKLYSNIFISLFLNMFVPQSTR